MNVSTPSVLRFLSVICHESPRYTHVFTEKAQHLWRWISMWMLTRGRLVPRQPRAIKNTTRTELSGERIYNVGKFLWDIGIIPTALRRYNIHNGGYIHWNISITPTALQRCNIHNGEYIHCNIATTPTALNNHHIRNNGHFYGNIGATPTALLNW